ncbi:MAG TPA: ABC transporter ATP-binding protein, partial [Chthoniobacteraceae bacterium]|nr:ABC transporter ATP-binding protein [Chthoniobacteraceae bacterium]
FLSTHQLSVAEEVADRIGIIHHGKLIALGTVAELRAQSRETGALESIFLSLVDAAPNGEKLTGKNAEKLKS